MPGHADEVARGGGDSGEPGQWQGPRPALLGNLMTVRVEPLRETSLGATPTAPSTLGVTSELILVAIDKR